jgi:hypothetical protein
MSFFKLDHLDAGPGLAAHVPVRAIHFGAIQFRASYANLRQPHIFKHQI